MSLEDLSNGGRILKIARFGHPVLTKICEKVKDPKAPEIRNIISDMSATILDFGPIAGLAAPQVHLSKCIIFYVINKSRADQYVPEGVPPTFLINPQYEHVTDQKELDWEGCLSAPDLLGEVSRYKSIRLTATTLEGNKIDKIVHGYEARVLQHEIDHLLGILYTRRMENLSRFGFTKEIVNNVINKEKHSM